MTPGIDAPLVTRADHGRVAILTLHRPEAGNALSNELMANLEVTLHLLELDPGVRSVVLTGTGDVFCAGADLARMQVHLEGTEAEARVHAVQPGQRLTRRIELFGKPVIAAVNGPAIGAGCDLVDAAHLALAAETATFCRHEIDLGLIPAFGGTQRLPRLAGRKMALDLLLTGRAIDAREALRLGLVNRVVPAPMLKHSALALADALASKPPHAVAAALRAVHRGAGLSLDDGLAAEEAAFTSIATGTEARDGLAPFGRVRAAAFARG